MSKTSDYEVTLMIKAGNGLSFVSRVTALNMDHALRIATLDATAKGWSRHDISQAAVVIKELQS